MSEPASGRIARRTVAHKQPMKGRLRLNDGSCIGLRPERPNHVWSYDFVQDRIHEGPFAVGPSDDGDGSSPMDGGSIIEWLHICRKRRS